VENFLDAYHVFKVHRETFGGAAETSMGAGTALSAHHVAVDEPDSELGVAHPENERLEGAWRHSTVIAAVFPTHLMQIQPDWLWHLQLRPLAVDRVAIRWSLSVAPEVLAAAADADAYVARVLDLLDRVNGEDRAVVEGVMRGLGRTSVPDAPMSALERNVHEFHRYLLGAIGADGGEPDVS
jgi:phenylpropionate dioxygenase-like ring-hydroxylating dioxygenase large terminal subunit